MGMVTVFRGRARPAGGAFSSPTGGSRLSWSTTPASTRRTWCSTWVPAAVP